MNAAHIQPLGAGFLLIAEDNPADVGLMRLALKKHAILSRIHLVEDGEAAVGFIEEVERDESALCPALAIVDLNLPRVRGDHILRRLRASDKWRDVPVIMVSSSLSARDRVDAMALGASAYFSKPSELDQFLELGALIKSILPAGE